MTPFAYPSGPHRRRHGPQGYANFESYRPWLRDEFAFRCVYCLFREAWHPQIFHVDHIEPVSIAPNRVCDYENLVYSCARCNLAKRDSFVGDPTQLLTSKSIIVQEDGAVAVRDNAPHSRQVKKLIQSLCLNSEQWRRWRRLWSALIALSAKHDRSLHDRLTGSPPDPPNLRRLRPPCGNTRPQGIDARRE